MNLKITVFAATLFLLATLARAQSNPVDFDSLIGQTLESEAIKSFLAPFENTPEVSQIDDGSFYILKEHGISLRFNNRKLLTTIFLYVQPSEGYKPYQGKLPFGLSKEEMRRSVEKRLGTPTEGRAYTMTNFQATYKDKLLTISYDTHDDDLTSHIEYIVLR